MSGPLHDPSAAFEPTGPSGAPVLATHRAARPARNLPTLALLLLGIVAVQACGDEDPMAPQEAELPGTLAFQQAFETNAANWIDNNTPGVEGWCGTIRQAGQNNGPVGASSGSGYALVEHGACNAFWQDVGFASSGPYSLFGPYSEGWPAGGFVTELDVWLDPAWSGAPDGSVLTYAVSVRLLDREFPGDARYFFVPVTRTGDGLQVMGSTVSAAGWYTLRHTFSDRDGALSVEAAVLREGTTLVSQRVTSTGLTGEAPGSFATSNVGTGTAWLVSIAPGLAVPIDEQELFFIVP